MARIKGKSITGESSQNEGGRYRRILLHVFTQKFTSGADQVPFDRPELIAAADAIGVEVPKNIGDLIYHFRHRAKLPREIVETAPKGRFWVIRPAGRSRYRLHAVELPDAKPNPALNVTKVPDGTPGIISRYAQTDEQALLAVIRYNRLVDIFTGVTCYSLQNHLRTAVTDLGQVESDEVYVGVDKKGVHYVFPVQAKAATGGKLTLVQVESDYLMCQEKFPGATCRLIGAHFLPNGVIAMFEFDVSERGLEVLSERHYILVPTAELTAGEIEKYRQSSE